MRQPTEIEVQVIDIQGYKNYMLEKLAGKDTDIIDFLDNGPFAIVDGKVFIDKYGVGMPIRDNQILGVVQLYPLFINGGMCGEATGQVNITKDILNSLPVKEVTTLDNFIVKFDDITENNYNYWLKVLSPKKTVTCPLIRAKEDLQRYSNWLIHDNCKCKKSIELIEVMPNLCEEYGHKHIHCKLCGGVI